MGKLTSLSATTTIASTDVFYMVNNVAVTPASKKVTAATVKNMVNTGSASFSYITCGAMSVGSASFSNITAATMAIGSASFSNITATTLWSDSASFSNAIATTFTAGSASFSNALATTLMAGSASFSNAVCTTFSINGNGAASAPPGKVIGTWFTGGSATTTKPQFLIEPTGTTSTGWATNGTGLGVNAPTGFNGNLMDLQVAGVSKGYIRYDGYLVLTQGISAQTVTVPAVHAGSCSFSSVTCGVMSVGSASFSNITSTTLTCGSASFSVITSPVIIGGSGITDTVTIKGTSGNGTATAAAINLKVGNNGATTAMTVLNNGKVGIGATDPQYSLQVTSTEASSYIMLTGANGTTAFGNDTGGNASIQAFTAGKDILFYDSVANTLLALKNSGKAGIGVAAPSAVLHIKAGTTAANTAPLKFNSGSLLTTAEAGAVEFLTDDFYATITTGAARKMFVLNDGTALTSGKIPIASTNGRLIDGQTPLAGTKIYYVSDTSGGTVNRKLTFTAGILTAET